MTLCPMAKANLYHVTKFPIYLSFTVHHFYLLISRFAQFLSIRIVLSCFIRSYSILRNSQLESDVCRFPDT